MVGEAELQDAGGTMNERFPSEEAFAVNLQ
jgi:hypothetical protein